MLSSFDYQITTSNFYQLYRGHQKEILYSEKKFFIKTFYKLLMQNNIPQLIITIYKESLSTFHLLGRTSWSRELNRTFTLKVSGSKPYIHFHNRKRKSWTYPHITYKISLHCLNMRSLELYLNFLFRKCLQFSYFELINLPPIENQETKLFF